RDHDVEDQSHPAAEQIRLLSLSGRRHEIAAPGTEHGIRDDLFLAAGTVHTNLWKWEGVERRYRDWSQRCGTRRCELQIWRAASIRKKRTGHVGFPYSAGFAICSPRGIGEPRRRRALGIKASECVPMCSRDGRALGRVA